MGDAVVISMKTDLCPTGGRENILRFDKSVDAAGDNSVPVDGGSDARAHIPDRDGRGDDIQKQVQDNEEQENVKDLVAEKGAVHDQVPVDEGGGKTKAPQDEVNLDKEVDVADQGAVNVEVPGSNGGSDAEVPERVDTTQVDNGGAVRDTVEEGGGAVPIKVDDTGGADNVRVPIAAGGGDGPVHPDGGSVMTEAADGGDYVRVQVLIDDGGGTASVEAEEGSDKAYDVVDTCGVLVNIHIDEGGGAVQVTERSDATKDDDNDREVQHTDVGAAPGQGDDGAGDICIQADQSPGAIKSSRTVMRKPVKRSPPVWQKHVQEPLPDRHGYVHKSGELGHHDVADRDQEVHHADEGDAVPVKEGGGDGAAHDPVDQGPGVRDGDAHEGGQDTPRRSPKPNPRYSPEVYDLSYVGVMQRSRKSIWRAER